MVHPPIAIPTLAKQKAGETLGLAIEHPRATHDSKRMGKSFYWQDMEFTGDYDVRKLAADLGSYFPSFMVFHITRPAPRSWGRRRWWWLGMAATIATGLGVWLLGWAALR